MDAIYAVVTIAVTLLGVAVLVLTAAEPLLVAAAEHGGPRQGRRRVHPQVDHRS
jgi:hypothetical protein